jgi:anthranilate 1,2-dioxygenase small subunit
MDMSKPQAPAGQAASAGLRTELRDLYDDYAAALDDLDFVRWTGFFTTDCVYRVVSLENWKETLSLSTIECHGAGSLRDRAAAIHQTTVFEPRTLRRMVSGVRVNAVLEDGEVQAQSNFTVYESLSDREPHLFMVGRYLDRLVRQDGRLLLRERVCVYDNYRVRTSLVYPI